jgi:hypothetical protein
MAADDLPVIPVPDWSPLRRAFADALADTTTFLPRDVERRVLAEIIDQLTAEGVELVERGTDATP